MNDYSPDMRKQILEWAQTEALAVANAALKVASDSSYNQPADPSYVAAVMSTLTQVYLSKMPNRS